jgi:enoyl-CoA hydratase
MGSYETIIVTTPVPSVALIQLNRPKAYNALNAVLFREIGVALKAAQDDDNILVIVLTGNSCVSLFSLRLDPHRLADQLFRKAFAAGYVRPVQETVKSSLSTEREASDYMCSDVLKDPT